jgi:WD40 repeat protein/serine/threonine protein kinase
MSTDSPCPTPQELHLFLLGDLDEEAVAAIGRHLAACANCRDALTSMPAEDALIQAVRAQSNNIVLPFQDSAEGLVRRLCHLESSASSAKDTAAGPPTSSDQVDEKYDFLAPAEQPGELGRLASYRVLKVLGSGGMGVVFLAEDLLLHRQVALKTLKSSVAANDVNRKRFLREAQAMAAIEHDHIAPIYQVGEARGVPYFAMQWLKGETLGQRLERESRLPVPEILRIGREIADGLAAAHERGLIHRDVKPSNIWLEADSGRVKLVDFGLARGTTDDVHLTDSGFVVGTPAYMSPEQARGRPVDGRSDLFSLGCVLYRMCAGQVPFQGTDTLGTLAALALDTPKPIRECNPDVSPALADLVTKLLAKNPDERLPDARAVSEALRKLEQRPAPQPLPPVAERTAGTKVLSEPQPRRSYGLALGIALALAATVLGVGYWYGPTRLQVASNGSRPDTGSPPAPSKDPEVLPMLVDWPPEEGPGLEEPPPPSKIGKIGAPLSSALALTSQPAPLAGVMSWTIETRGHRGPVRSVAYSPTGRWLATSGADGTIRLWESANGKLARILVGHNYGVDGVAWAADGRLLASRAYDGTVRLWDPESGKQQHAHSVGSAHALALSPDGKTFATAGADKEIRLWDAGTGKPLRSLDQHGSDIFSLAWSPNGKTLAAGGTDRVIYLWAMDGGPDPTRLQGHKDRIHDLVWSPDSAMLVSVSKDRTLRLWTVASGEARRVYTWEVTNTKSGGVASSSILAWSPDGKNLASVNADGVQIWDPHSERLTPIRTIALNGRALSWAAKGQNLAIVTHNEPEIVSIHSAGNGKRLSSLPGMPMERMRELAWSPDGKRFAMRTDKTIYVWSADSGELIQTVEGPGREIAGLAWSPDGNQLASTSGWGNQLLIYHASTAKLLRTFAGTSRHLGAVAWSPNGKWLAAAAGQPPEVLVWELDANKAEPLHLSGFKAGITGLSWSADGNTLVSSSADGAAGVQLWALPSRKPRVTVRPFNGTTSAAAVSADDKLLAAGGVDGLVRIYDLALGKFRNDLKGQSGRVVGLTWLADNKTAVARGEDTTLRFWDSGSGGLEKTFAGRPGLWNFLPERGLLASGSFSYTVRFREVDSNRPQATLVLLQQGQSAAFLTVSPEGHYRASPSLEPELVYVVKTEHGQDLLTAAEFKERYQWVNDRQRTKLDALPAAAK